MAEGASTGPTDEETRMFLEAASAGHDVLVQRMLMSPNKAALMEAQTSQGHCAIHVASVNGHAKVVASLLRAGE